MSTFRRTRYGSTYFFTVIAFRRRPILCDDAVRHALRDALVRTRARLPFTVDAMVLLPDHLHCIWTLPEDDVDYSSRWAQIKHHVSYLCRERYGDFAQTKSNQRRGESAIWQRRFWEHTIRDEADLERHVDYIHYNPVKHGLVDQVAAWPHSTFHRYVRNEIYPVDWGGTDAARGMMLE
ncbi:transposase [Massilia sp. ST3]|uniref:REP-associated tyrosine transposase n=1 Tax=Massilia sp. ST3 TaxID=2824903 RepID=UPI001B82D852|nr:transposase [Massilia sp. ST3]MBQ5949611.1 transposase [Massilia sp. ST3]